MIKIKWRDISNRVSTWYYSLIGDGEYDMTKANKMKYSVKDNTYRDIYSRDIPVESKSKFIVWFFPIMGVVVIQFFILVLIPLIMTKLVAGASGHYFKMVAFLYIVPFAGLVRGLLALGVTLAVYVVFKIFAERYWQSQNADDDSSLLDNPEYADASRIVQPEELTEKFDIFPDAGMHSKNTDVTAILGHMNLTNDGLNTVLMPLRADGKTDKDDDGNVINKNVPFYDENDELVYVSKQMIDEDMGEALWDSSGIPRPYGKNANYIKNVLRSRYSPDDLLYNPSKKFGKSKEYTVAEKINNDWYMPEFEVKRPAGCYVVDTEPNNTMVCAMTRAGKGQTVIEPTIDCWLRSDARSNVVCNDPKGELYRKFFYIARKRGYRVVAFNLMEPSKTDIYNPLGYAVEAARQGDNQKVEEYVKTIGDVFFPPDKADDPMWPNAANAAFQRSALGLIDYYMEEERELRDKALLGNWTTAQLERALDESWGHVTLYNVYQMMVQLAAKKSKDAKFIHLDDDDPTDEKDFLTLFFDATAMLPTNALRMSVQNQDQSLRAMAGSDKTISSVYGISLTAIKFFADDRISHLTSGRPSQNFDIVGMSFPRRFDVKMDYKFVKDEGLRGQVYKWKAYLDDKFERPLGSEFEYENNINPFGWISYVTKGIFPQNTIYFTLNICEQYTDLPVKTYYLKFEKGYQMTLDGRAYVIDPVTNERVVRDGYLSEVKPSENGAVKHDTLLQRQRISLLENHGDMQGSLGSVEKYKVLLFSQFQVHYSEEPVFVDFITPPHLRSYARIILILINQMFNMQVDKSYLTLANQQPFFKTKYMLDEVGNLSSDGSGIPDIQTKESIGLAQGQQFTLILQTLQQLKDVYGDSIDKILQGNTGNILYIKSTDDSMLEILQGLGGQRYRIEHDSLTTTTDMYKIIATVDGKQSRGKSVKEVPVISKNDMLRVNKGDLMVFGKGDPIWNTNQCAMPYAFELVHKDALNDWDDPKEYTMQTVPTTASTMDFDILNNQPNFINMVTKRCVQARETKDKLELFKQYNTVNGRPLTDDDLSRMDPEALAKEIMRSVNQQINFNEHVKEIKAKEPSYDEDDIVEVSDLSIDDLAQKMNDSAERNDEFYEGMYEADKLHDDLHSLIYADDQISKYDLIRDPSDDLNDALAYGYVQLLDDFKNSDNYTVSDDGSLYLGSTLMIKSLSEDLAEVGLDHLMADGESDNYTARCEVMPAWRELLARNNIWDVLDGKYESVVASRFRSLA